MYNVYEMNIHSLLYHFRKRMNALLIDESRKPMGYESEPHWVLDKIENEILYEVDQILDYEPSDEEMGYGGEPPITMAEMHEAARAQSRAMHS